MIRSAVVEVYGLRPKDNPTPSYEPDLDPVHRALQDDIDVHEAVLADRQGDGAAVLHRDDFGERQLLLTRPPAKAFAFNR